VAKSHSQLKPSTIDSTQLNVNVFASVRLSVCMLARLPGRYSKTRACIWMKCYVSTDVGTWTN